MVIKHVMIYSDMYVKKAVLNSSFQGVQVLKSVEMKSNSSLFISSSNLWMQQYHRFSVDKIVCKYVQIYTLFSCPTNGY